MPGAGFDLSYLGLWRPDAEFVQGTGDELRHSTGARLFGERSGWDWNFEGVVQFGSFGGSNLLAWTFASDTGFTFRGAPLAPRLGLRLTKRLKLTADWDVFWRQSAGDGLYDSGGNVLRAPGGSEARFVGHQPGLGLEWELGRHATLSAAYAHFFTGAFLRQSGPSAEVDFVAVWLSYRF